MKAPIRIKDFVLDRLMSGIVKTSPYYDFNYLREHAERFYGDPNEIDGQILDDWVAFDFWREHLFKR